MDARLSLEAVEAMVAERRRLAERDSSARQLQAGKRPRRHRPTLRLNTRPSER